MAFDLATAKPVGFDLSTAKPERQQIPAKPPVDKNRQRGVELPSGLQGGMAALQGPTFGFADEIAGAVSAGGQLLTGDTNVGRNYAATRDMYRGAVDDAQQRNPILTATTQVAASAPLLLLTRGAGVGAGAGAPVAAPIARMTMGRAAATAGQSGAIYGGASGLGNSESGTVAGNMIDTGIGAVTSGVLGAGSVPVGRTMGAAGSGVMSRIKEASAHSYAKQKVAEALIRDARGRVPQAVPSGGISQASAKLGQLGDDAMLVDAGGQNTRALLDMAASTPGRTKDAAERAIRARQATRGGRIGAAAEGALGTQNTAYVGSLEAFDQARQAAAAPLYRQLDNVALQVDDGLAGLLARSKGYHGEAQKLAQVSGKPVAPLSDIQPGQSVPLASLDTLKQTLFDAADAAKRAGNRKMGAAIDELRVSLVGKLDDLSPKDQAGNSIYKAARDAWAGPSSSMSAAELGRSILKEDALSIPALTRGLSASEMDAFRIGVTQAVKDKAGTQSGQTQLLKMWANPGTRDKLRAVFGNDFRRFSAAIMGEERKKGLESVGRGSQTAARQFGADDLDMSAVLDAGQAAGSVMRGSPLGMWDVVRNRMSQVQTPEAVRDEMGRLLMQRGPQARNSLNELMQYSDEINRARAARAAGSGLFFGAQLPGLIVE